MSSITVPLHQAGEPAVDLNDLWAQLATGRERFAVTVQRDHNPLPRRFHVTVNGRGI